MIPPIEGVLHEAETVAALPSVSVRHDCGTDARSNCPGIAPGNEWAVAGLMFPAWTVDK